MNDPLGMGGIQRVSNLNPQLHYLVNFHSLPGDAVLERLTFQKLHGNEVLAFVLVDFMNGADVGMVQGRGGASFALEAFQGLVISGQLFGKEFESDKAAELGVLGLVHHAHPTSTQLLQDAIMRDSLADHRETTCPWAASLGRTSAQVNAGK